MLLDHPLLTLSFDCDYAEDVMALPRVAEMLKRLGVPGSFAVVGRWVEEYPAEHEKLLECGHELVNHTYTHPDNEILNPGRKFRYLSVEQKQEEVTVCHDIVKERLGYELKGLRIPHFKKLFSKDIYHILERIGYTFSSSTWVTGTLSRGFPFLADGGIVEFPLATCPSHPFTVFDTWHSLRSRRLLYRVKHSRPEEYLALFEELLKIAEENFIYLNLYLDPRDIGELHAFEELLSRAISRGIQFVTYESYLKNRYRILGGLS